MDDPIELGQEQVLRLKRCRLFVLVVNNGFHALSFTDNLGDLILVGSTIAAATATKRRGQDRLFRTCNVPIRSALMHMILESFPRSKCSEILET